MEGMGDHIERRVERVQFETDRHLIVGNVTLPPEGYQSRFSDSLNRPDIEFIPVVDVEIMPIEGRRGRAPCTSSSSAKRTSGSPSRSKRFARPAERSRLPLA